MVCRRGIRVTSYPEGGLVRAPTSRDVRGVCLGSSGKVCNKARRCRTSLVKQLVRVKKLRELSLVISFFLAIFQPRGLCRVYVRKILVL